MDFSDALDQKAEEVVRPLPYPVGSYRAMVDSYKMVESSQKKTPGVEFTYKLLDPMEDVDAEQLAIYEARHPGGVRGKLIKESFWLTQDALYRLTEHMEKHLGIEPEGRTIGQMLPDTKNQEVCISIVHNPSQRDKEVMFAQIAAFANPASLEDEGIAA